METWWKVSRYGHIAEPVRVARSTEQTIYIDGRKGGDRKHTEWADYYPTEDAAYDHIEDRLRGEVERGKLIAHAANSRLGEVRARRKALANARPAGVGTPAAAPSPEAPPDQQANVQESALFTKHEHEQNPNAIGRQE